MSLEISERRQHQPPPGDDAARVVTPGKPSEPLEVSNANDNGISGEPVVVAEDESQYPVGLPRYLLIFATCLVVMLTSMDGSIVSVAVPAITDQFHTVQDIGWYSAAYRLCACSFQFMFGKLYKIFPIKKVFLTSIAIFMVGSVVCAVAPISPVFVLGRAICGFASAGISAGCFTVLLTCLPMRQRPMYTGIAGCASGVAGIAAPVLGGVIVDRAGWRWCFWMNLPLGFVTVVSLFFYLVDSKSQVDLTRAQQISELDLVGTAFFIPSLTCLFLALSWAGSKYAWNSPTIIGLFCTFGVLLGLFIVEQRRKGDAAVLPPRIMGNRSVLAGLTYTLFCNAATMVVLYYLPTYYQSVRNYNAAQSGYLQFPLIVGDMIGVMFQSAGVTIIGYYTPFMIIGSVLMPIIAGLLTTTTVNTAMAKILVLSGIYGFAGGVGFLSPQSAVQMALPKEDASIGLSIILFAEQFGPAVFVSAAQSIFQNRLADNLGQLVPSLNATDIESMGLSELRASVSPENLDSVLIGFDKSLAQTWYLAVALACVTIIGSATMDWRSIKQKQS